MSPNVFTCACVTRSGRARTSPWTLIMAQPSRMSQGSAGPPPVDELRAHVRTLLAGFKVPTEWVVAAELPRNASGKLLRRRLTIDRPDANQ